MNPRPYRSPLREAAAGITRKRIINAASALLGAPKGFEGFSLDAVARKARVTRLTVYNQFGSRRALLEEVFDDIAARGGLHRIAEAMADRDPHRALQCIIVIFCDFWSFDTPALLRLHAAGAGDAELEESVRERNERRRHLLTNLARRMAGRRTSRSNGSKELVDVLFALTSLPFFAQLISGGHSTEWACKVIQGLCEDSVRRGGLGERGVRALCRTRKTHSRADRA